MTSPFTARLIVDTTLAGKRIDTFLIRHFRNYTAFRMQRLVRAGQVLVDGIAVKPRSRVFAGQEVTVRLVEPPDKLLEPEPIPIDVLFEDAWLIVVNKPPGQVAHPTGKFLRGTLANAVQHHLDLQSQQKGILRPGVVHRLDRLTSGVMVLAKEHLSHRRLGIMFEQHCVSKNYLALVDGVVCQDQTSIRFPIGRAPRLSCSLMSCASDAENPREAWTDVEVIERFDGHSLLSVRPRTGRLHQIRVHLAAIGHPVSNDKYYGRFGAIRQLPDSKNWTAIESVVENDQPVVSSTNGRCFNLDQHALHAFRLEFDHPISNQPMKFEAPLPQDLEQAIQSVRIASSINAATVEPVQNK